MKDTRMHMILVVLFLVWGCSSLDVEPVPDDNPIDDRNAPVTLKDIPFDKNYVFLEGTSKVKDRNFYWTTIIEKSGVVTNVLKQNEELSNFLETAKDRVNTVLAQGNQTTTEYAEALSFKDNDRVLIANAIAKASAKSEFVDITEKHIQSSGAFNRFAEITNRTRLHQLIAEEVLLGINHIINVYVAGNDPRYPELDRVSFDVNSEFYKTKLKDLATNIKNDTHNLFYEPFLKFALGALELNSRYEAGRFEPLSNGENKATSNFLKTVVWNDYDYSIIVVLGDAPNSPGDLPNISQGGIARADHAVELYNQGKAPIIAFTGGNVAPFQTTFHEAIEMKKYVMETYNIPENRILVEPHARHTTTNMRNIGRQIFRYGIQDDKKAIVSTSSRHSESISSPSFLTRCQNEMKHIPLKIHNRLSDFDLEFTPLIEVLHLDSSDPLDP